MNQTRKDYYILQFFSVVMKTKIISCVSCSKCQMVVPSIVAIVSKRQVASVSCSQCQLAVGSGSATQCKQMVSDRSNTTCRTMQCIPFEHNLWCTLLEVEFAVKQKFQTVLKDLLTHFIMSNLNIAVIFGYLKCLHFLLRLDLYHLCILLGDLQLQRIYTSKHHTGFTRIISIVHFFTVFKLTVKGRNRKKVISFLFPQGAHTTYFPIANTPLNISWCSFQPLFSFGMHLICVLLQ